MGFLFLSFQITFRLLYPNSTRANRAERRFTRARFTRRQSHFQKALPQNLALQELYPFAAR